MIRSHFHESGGRETSRRFAFTLVELLVVIAIIGVLIALLLPAVQAARESARRMQCTNHLKQIGIALHNYHDTVRVLPPGWIYLSTGTETGLERPYWGWNTFILPFMEQQSLYDALNPKERLLQTICRGNNITGTTDTLTADDKTLVQTVISTLRCPSDNGSRLNDDTTHFGNTTKTVHLSKENNPVAKSNYAACMGESNYDSTSGNDNNGVFYANSSKTFGRLADGTSNIVFVGEVCTSIGEYKYFATTWLGVGGPGCLGDGSQGATGSSDEDNDAGAYRTVRRMKHDILINTARPENLNKSYSSCHAGGANFVFGDGSVRLIPETISTSVYDLLGRRSSGKAKSF